MGISSPVALFLQRIFINVHVPGMETIVLLISTTGQTPCTEKAPDCLAPFIVLFNKNFIPNVISVPLRNH